MIRSMTGYGRSEKTFDKYILTIELKAVNHKYLDINLRCPKAFIPYEIPIKKIVQEKINRGKIDMFINLDTVLGTNTEIVINEKQIDYYNTMLTQISQNLDIEYSPKIDMYLGLPDVLHREDSKLEDDVIAPILLEVTSNAIDEFLKMSTSEGNHLKEGIRLNVCHMIEKREELKKRSKEVPIEYKEKLEKKMDQLLDDQLRPLFDEQRLEAELLIFADKVDVEEEIVRLEGHLIEFMRILEEESIVGKKLDFLCQEINRELNTVGAKANDFEMTHLVVSMKSHLEKVREQVQNLA